MKSSSSILILILVIVLILILLILSLNTSNESYQTQNLYCYPTDQLRQDETGKTFFLNQNKDELKASQILPMPDWFDFSAPFPRCNDNEAGGSYGPGQCGVCVRDLPPGSDMTICTQGDAKEDCVNMFNGTFRGYTPW